MKGAEAEVTLPIEDPQPGRVVKGLVPRSMFVWGLGLLALVLVGFFAADVLRQQVGGGEKQATPVADASSAPTAHIVAAAPSPRDIEEIAARARAVKPFEAENDAVAVPVFNEPGVAPAADVRSGAASGVKAPAYAEPAPGALRAGSSNAPFRSGRPADELVLRPDYQGGAGTAVAQQIAERNTSAINALEEGASTEGERGMDVPGKLARLQAGGGIEVVPSGEIEAAKYARDAAKAQADLIAAVNSAAKPNPVVNRDQQWLKEYSQEGADSSVRSKVTQLPVDGLVLQGTRIPVVGLEAVSSDMPGQVTARSTVDIYDSLHQRRVAIPRHTRFIGSYSSEIRPGQTRVLFAFRRMVLPDGRSVDLSAAQGVDNIGRAGIEGDVDNHFLKMFGHSFAIAWISSKLSNRDGLTTSSTTNGQTSTGTVAGEVLSQVAQQILQRNAQIPPTISLPVGFPFFITLSKDVVLAPVGVSNVR